MEIGTEQPRRPSEITRYSADEIQAHVSLLRQAWACIGNQKSQGEIRSELKAIGMQSELLAHKALEVFDALAVRVADLQRDPEPEWLRTVLRGKSPESLSVQLTPTAIVLNIPENLFSEIRPGSAGVTLSDAALPQELRGRIILMPNPPRSRHEITLRHELIHSIESWEPKTGPYPTDAYRAIREAKTQGDVLEQIAGMGFFPRERARSEVTAYIGSGSSASSLESYGLKEARQELDLVFKGLALNNNLSRVEKVAMYEKAAERYRQHILDAVALSVNFEELAQKIGLENAVAQIVVQGFGEVDNGLIPRRVETLYKRLEDALGRVSVDSNLSEWLTTEWDTLSQEVPLLPHPTLVPLVIEAIHRSELPVLLVDFIEAFERAVEWNPEILAEVDIDRLHDRLRSLAEREDPLYGYVRKSAVNLLERLANGGLMLAPFSAKELHPYIRIGDALFREAPISQLAHLLCEVYPDRHPIWNEIPAGIVNDRVSDATPEDKILLSLAVAEHSSQEHDTVWSVILLGGRAEYGQLSEAQLATLRRVVPHLPAVEQVSWYSEESKLWYQQALTKFMAV